MRLQTKAQVTRSSHSSSRRAAPASLGLRPPGRSDRPGRARRQVRPRDAESGCSRPRPVRGQGSRRAERSAPMIPLTLLAMLGLRRQSHSSARPTFATVSVLALLAFACLPGLAQAETGIPEYETEIPSVPSHQKHHTSENSQPAESSSAGGGNHGSSSAGGSGGGGTGSGSSGGQSSGGGGAGSSEPIANNHGNGGGNGQSTQGNGSTNGQQTAKPGVEQKSTSNSSGSGGGSSSPLVPILIAIAALAAISIGAVVIRQRRSRGSGSPVSPKAN